MKRNDYINIQAPMISDLHLKGNELLVFALIHGYTKDGKSRCRVSLNYMAKWLSTDKSMIIKVVNTLEKAGYINRHEYLEGLVRCVEYSTNYEALLDRVANGEKVSLEKVKKPRGVKMTPASECTLAEGCQNDTGVKMTSKGCQNDIKRGVKMTPNNKYIIIYNNFFIAEPALPEEEKKIFTKIFFLKKAADPAAEAERFIGYNQANGWRSKEGKVVYETFEQKVGLAHLWEFKMGEAEGVQRRYAEAIGNLVDDAVKMNIDDVEVMVNCKHGIKWNRSENKWHWTITKDAQEWIYKAKANKELVHRHLDPIFNNVPVAFDRVS